MINLRDTTFIIPVRLESPDRAFNFRYVVQYLCRNFDTNIFVWESDKKPIARELLSRINAHGTKITYHFDKCDDGIFHRTRLLNEMIHEVKTPVVVNYDADIILEINAYVQSRDAILAGSDLVYPYYIGNSQRKVFRASINHDLTQEIKHEMARSEYGHCCFLNTESYRKVGMENERFISYAPEDAERAHRFKTLGYKVEWLGNLVYHIEHARGINSGRNNPHFENNMKLWDQLRTMPVIDLCEYYKTAPYMIKYRHPHIKLLTYSDNNFRAKQQQLCLRAIGLGAVDSSFAATREDLVQTDFYHDNKVLLDMPRGNGYWAWKPFYILEALNTLNENDILVYLDSGDWVSSSFKEFLIRKMRTHDVFLTDGSYPNKVWTKRRVFDEMGCDEQKYWDAIQVEAGIVICRKCDRTMELMREWLRLCLMPGLVTDEPSQGNFPEFKENRHDQSILSLMKVKHDIHSSEEMRQYINCNQNKG